MSNDVISQKLDKNGGSDTEYTLPDVIIVIANVRRAQRYNSCFIHH